MNTREQGLLLVGSQIVDPPLLRHVESHRIEEKEEEDNLHVVDTPHLSSSSSGHPAVRISQ